MKCLEKILSILPDGIFITDDMVSYRVKDGEVIEVCFGDSPVVAQIGTIDDDPK